MFPPKSCWEPGDSHPRFLTGIISSVGNLVIFVDGQCSEKLFAPLRYCL